jgi:hypothetical protein
MEKQIETDDLTLASYLRTELGRMQAEYLQDLEDGLDALQRSNSGVPLKHCSRCWTVYPGTTEHFRRNRTAPYGLDYYCKACRNIYQSRYRRAFPVMFKRYDREYRQSRRVIRLAFEERGIPFTGPGGEKRCPRCQQDKPLTREYYHRSLSRPDGFQTYCKVCRSKAVRS